MRRCWRGCLAQPYLEAVRERVVVFDGAFGTYIQALDLGADDFGGPDLEGCNEMLCLTRPDVIADMHDAFFAVGVDVVETATFGASRPCSPSTAIADRAYELNLAAARIAREVADDYAADGRPRYVAGSIGPGHQAAVASATSASPTLRDAYEEQARGLLEGGVDLFLIETCMDLLQAKAAMVGCRRAMAAERAAGADAGAGDHGDHRADARRLRDRRRADVARGHASPTCSASTAPPARRR